ncbi:MAG TPA: GNAT family N-acetyltransferase [Candidatus Coatesbacteria bacterium]|nr:GNAT family N-acetyltransferase [Candidatus Coatesbacteria bacterium]
MFIRRYREDDLPARVGLWNLGNPLPASLEAARHAEENIPPDRLVMRFVGEFDGRVMACASIVGGGFAEPGTFQLYLAVHPEHRGRGHGRALWELLERQLDHLAWRKLLAQVRADREEALAMLSRRGFAVAHEDLFLRLDMARYERPADYAERIRRVELQGILIRPWAEINDNHKERRLWRIFEDSEADVPHAVPYRKRGFEEWKRAFENPAMELDTYVVALEGEDFVGVTGLMLPGGPGAPAMPLITGTVPARRGRGVATAVKYAAMEIYKERGVPALVTGNARENAAMLAINKKLGFEHVPSVLSLVKERGDAV